MVCGLVSQYILISLSLAYNENKLYKTLDYGFRDILNVDFLEKGLGIVSRCAWLFKKTFTSILKGFQLSKIVSDLRVHLQDNLFIF